MFNGHVGGYQADLFTFTNTGWTASNVAWYGGFSSKSFTGPSHIANVSWKYGIPTPNYFELLKAGAILPYTNLERGSITGRMTSNSFYDSRDTSRGYPAFTRSCSGIFHAYALTEADLRNYFDLAPAAYYVDKAAAAIYARGFDALTFAGEFGRTLQMLRKTVNRVRKLRRGLPDEKVPFSWSDLTGQNANAWLEWRYGWRPLISDMKKLLKMTAELDVRRTRFTEKQGDTDMFTHTFSITDTLIHPYLDSYAQVTDEVTVSHRGMVTADIDPAKFRFNAITTAWELVPYSFVVDWLVDVGTFLEGMSFLTYTTGYRAGASSKVSIKRSITGTWTLKPSAPSDWSGGGSFSGSYTGWLQGRVPSEVSFYPHFNPSLTKYQIADLGALIRQKLTKEKYSGSYDHSTHRVRR